MWLVYHPGPAGPGWRGERWLSHVLGAGNVAGVPPGPGASTDSGWRVEAYAVTRRARGGTASL